MVEERGSCLRQKLKLQIDCRINQGFVNLPKFGYFIYQNHNNSSRSGYETKVKTKQETCLFTITYLPLINMHYYIYTVV